jgi:hypothetical protein
MKTFYDLYEFLRKYDGLIVDFLKEPWVGKDKQESLFRLFAYLGLIPEFTDYYICSGNFNNITLKSVKTKHEITSLFEQNLKDKGDKSDLSLMHKIEKKLIISTSKNLKNLHIGDLDIRDLEFLVQNYKSYSYKICIMVRNKSKFYQIVNQSEKCNTDIKNACKDAFIFDWNDIVIWYNNFKINYETIPYKTMISEQKSPINIRFHQELTIRRTMRLKSVYKSVLWGHIPRSGKTYILAGLILRDDENHDETSNYLIITTAPNETIQQYLNLFNSTLQFCDFNIIHLNGKQTLKLQHRNIIIVSKQYLQNKSIKWLSNINFDIRFIDESHNGGTTELAHKMLNLYGKSAFTIYITATYFKPITEFNIPSEAQITWTAEDINLCANIDNKQNLDKLIEIHGSEIQGLLKIYSLESIKSSYSIYPDLHILTLEFQEQLKYNFMSFIDAQNYEGWSLEAIMQLCENKKKELIPEFIKKNDIKLLLKNIFGNLASVPINHQLSKERGLLDRVELIAQKNNSRWFSCENPLVILCFLPCGGLNLPIDLLSQAFINIIEKEKIIPDFEIISINSISNKGDPKTIIQDAIIKAKNINKKGVLVLSGRQCSLGVTIRECDVVLLMNNSNSYDLIYQMMFRCMSEAPNKRCGYVLDLNIQRSINILVEYSAKLHIPSIRESIKYVLEHRLISLNADYWLKEYFKLSSLNIDDITNKIYDIWISKPSNCIKNILNNLKLKLILNSNNQNELNKYILHKDNAKTSQKSSINVMKSKDINIDKGLVKSVANSEINTKLHKEKDKNVNFIHDVIRHLIPVVCFLSRNDDSITFEDICTFILENKELKEILFTQIKNFWGKNIPINILDLFIKIVKEMEQNDQNKLNCLTQQIKEIFVKSKSDHRKLVELMDEYFIPSELEKKNNAEVSTPFSLRNDMESVMSVEFWTDPNKKVFEPCSGKGGFLLDLFNKFDKGLTKKIPDKKSRHKHIVEKCIYFADINLFNIYIGKCILDPNSEYKLNFHEGNTLELDINEKWSLTGFDLVIGNPPYNMSGNTATGNTIWQHFVKLALDKWVKPNGYLTFVHPSGWRKPCYEKSQLKGLFKLMTQENQMIYLEIHGIKDGQITFNCGTRYDWYLIQKCVKHRNTKVKDENGIDLEIDLSEWNWLPNSNINQIKKILAKNVDERYEIIYSRSNYGADRSHVSDEKTQEFKYPLIHSTPKSGVRYKYSKYNNKGHFGIKKIIFGDAGINNVIIDLKGKYGMTQHSIAIKINDLNEANNVKKALLSNKFQSILKSCIFGNFQIDWKLFTDFKKDFWKEFI